MDKFSFYRIQNAVPKIPEYLYVARMYHHYKHQMVIIF